MRLISKEVEESPYYQLTVNLKIALEVYKAAVLVSFLDEIQTLQLLEKTGLESTSQILAKDKYKQAVSTLNTLSENQESIEIEFTDREIIIIRAVQKRKLKEIKDIPKFAREQLLITYATLVEGFVLDTIKNFFKKFPQSLKSNKSTLKDNQLIDSIIEGNTLEKLIDFRVRDIMYGSIAEWIDFFNKNGLIIKEEKNLKEMFLIRNILIHNNKRVSVELVKEIGGIRYSIGNKINITENDIKRFKAALNKTTKNITMEYNRKTR